VKPEVKAEVKVEIDVENHGKEIGIKVVSVSTMQKYVFFKYFSFVYSRQVSKVLQNILVSSVMPLHHAQF
jgi:hypothetical protein